MPAFLPVMAGEVIENLVRFLRGSGGEIGVTVVNAFHVGRLSANRQEVLVELLWRTWLAGKRLPHHFGKAGVQDWIGDARELIGDGARPVFGRPQSGNKPCPPQNRVILGFFKSLGKGKELSKHIKTLYVDSPQKTTLLLPSSSTGFYADGNSAGKRMENSGKQNPKMGFKSPPSRNALL
jgi:hypothetical protein